MSFSVDDLVSSLSSNHISQEAIDLAILQNQLAETLYGGPSFSNANGNNHHISNAYNRGRSMTFSPRGCGQNTQPCTTPIARTPSLSSNHGWRVATDMSRSRRNSVSSLYLDNMMEDEKTIPVDSRRSRRNSVSSAFMDDMEEDERTVEELLIPSPSLSVSLSGSQFGSIFLSSAPQPSSTQSNANQGYPSHNFYSDPSPSSPTGSNFTTTDPFYIAQLQSLNGATHSQSMFAQNGRLPQSSPFAQYGQFHTHGQNVAMSVNHQSTPFSAL